MKAQTRKIRSPSEVNKRKRKNEREMIELGKVSEQTKEAGGPEARDFFVSTPVRISGKVGLLVHRSIISIMPDALIGELFAPPFQAKVSS